MQHGEDRVARPSGPLSGRRRPWRRRLGQAIVGAGQVVAQTPLGTWLHRRLRADVEFSMTRVELAPERFAGRFDVAFLSDLHAGFFMSGADLLDLAQRTNALHPDLVCFVGDLVDSSWRQVELFEEALAVLRPPLGTWVVPGNHEYYRDVDLERWEAFLSERGAHVLVNRGRRVEVEGDTLWVAGVDDLTEGAPDLARALEGRRDDEACLLLSHHPDVFAVARAFGIDLQLSGHTHGGQVRLGPWTPLTHSKYGFQEGLHRDGASHLYVGRGVGVTVLPLRVGARPEVALVQVRGRDG